MGMQKILSSETLSQCIELSKAALERPEGLTIKCRTKS